MENQTSGQQMTQTMKTASIHKFWKSSVSWASMSTKWVNTDVDLVSISVVVRAFEEILIHRTQVDQKFAYKNSENVYLMEINRETVDGAF